MSLEIQTFVPDIDDAVVPRWMERMNDLGMQCEIYPNFSFKGYRGFLPFRVALERSAHKDLVGICYLTGFEFYNRDFNLATELDAITPRLTLIAKIIRRRPEAIYFATPEIDQRLATCRKVLSFVWGSSDTLELRMATLSSAVLAEIAVGVCYYPAGKIWYSNEGIAENALREVETYEASLKPGEWKLQKFDRWP